MPHTYIPISLTSSLWIIPSHLLILQSILTIICPDKANSTVHLQQPFYMLRLSPTLSATSNYFHLPPHCEYHSMVMNISLDTININTINISTLDFRTWLHFNRNQTHFHLQRLTKVPEVPVAQLYRGMINTSEPIHSFPIKDDDEDSSLTWAILKHPWTYIGTIGRIFAVCIGVYCFKRF